MKTVLTMSALALVACASPASAQETPPAPAPATCPCPPPPPPPPPFTGRAELSFVATGGNTSTQTLGAGLDLGYKADPWGLAFKAGYVRARAEGSLTAETAEALLRGTRKLAPPLDAYAQAGWYRNRFAGVDARFTAEAGLAYKLLTGPEHTASAEAGVGWVSENRVVGDDPRSATARLGGTYKWAFSKSADLTDEAGFTFLFSETKDWRFRNRAALTASLTGLLSVKLGWGFDYLNRPAPGFGKTDTITSAALVAKF